MANDDAAFGPVAHTLVLVATLRTALNASASIEARRLGRDPSGQEPEGQAREDLYAVMGSIDTQLLRLRLRVAAGAATDDEARLIREFTGRLALTDLAEELRLAHQKLLSLYPIVDESLIEEMRLFGVEVGKQAGQEGPGALPEDLLEPLADLLHDLRLVLVERA